MSDKGKREAERKMKAEERELEKIQRAKQREAARRKEGGTTTKAGS